MNKIELGPKATLVTPPQKAVAGGAFLSDLSAQVIAPTSSLPKKGAIEMTARILLFG
jgi:hypothetical protein